jgi:uncharacterized protein YuzE
VKLERPTVQVTFDPSVDAAYVEIVDHKDGEAVEQVNVTPPHGEGDVVLDFDKDGRLLGIEVIGARRTLRPETLKTAVPTPEAPEPSED